MKSPLAEVGFFCGRYYLSVADIVVAMEGDCCRAILPEEVLEPIPAEELSTASIGGKPARDLPLEMVRFFRRDNWTKEMLEYAARQINDRAA